MATTPLVNTETSADDNAGPKIDWLAIIWFGALLVACYAPILYRMGLQWANDEDMGHGFFVPVVAGYIAWRRRAELAATPPKTNWWGLAAVVFAGLMSVIATLGVELFTARLSFVVALVGTVLFLGGVKWIKLLAFPLSLLLFMIPIPAIIYSSLTLRLQMFASQFAEMLISAVGIPVLREGNTLKLPSQTLDIVDACSGIRSLLSLLFLSLVYAYFTDKKVWMRWALLFATVPIAILANGIRVGVTGMLSEVDTKLASGIYHETEGYILFIIALVALIIVHRLINLIVKRFGKA